MAAGFPILSEHSGDALPCDPSRRRTRKQRPHPAVKSTVCCATYSRLPGADRVATDALLLSARNPYAEVVLSITASRAGAKDGIGLGLSIARSVLTAHHATLTANSQPAGGLNISVAPPAEQSIG